MARFLAGMSLAVLLCDQIQAQVLLGPVGYGGGYRGGIGFSAGGKRVKVAGFVGGWSAPAPLYGPACWGTPYYAGGPVWWQPPIYVPPPTVIVVQQPFVAPPVGFNGGFARQPEILPLDAIDPLPAARVDARVQRGDLIAVRPQRNAVKQAAAVEPAKPAVAMRPEPIAVPQEPKARAAFEVARAKQAFADGEYGRASERLADAIAADPTSPLPYFLLAQARTARGEYAEAVAAIREGMRRAPDWPASGFNVKELYGENAAKFEEHLAELRGAVAAEPEDPTLTFLLGYHLWFLGEKADAVKLFQKATKQVRDNGIIERFLLEADGKL